MENKPDLRRLGFHYYPDTLHYTQRDIRTWLPLLTEIGVSWLVLKSDANRAIPEAFISALIKAGIQPLIQFDLPLSQPPDPASLTPILEAYVHWGADHIQFFDRPNLRSSWPSNNWTQEDLVERFLDRFLPVAQIVTAAGGHPVFPALEPGGHFWDTAFLRSALQAMLRRKQTSILDNLVIAAYGWTFKHPLDWGAGGPERWPETRPYHTPENSQDQLGFHIYDWYRAVMLTVMEKPCPMVILQAGLPDHPSRLTLKAADLEELNQQNLDIFHRLTIAEGQKNLDEDLVLPEDVIGCAFYLLAADPHSPEYTLAWFDAQAPLSAAAKTISQNFTPSKPQEEIPGMLDDAFLRKVSHPIRHYLYLDPERDIQDILPFINHHHPTVGFSMDEALLAARVTIVGGETALAPEWLARLKRSGIQIDFIGQVA